MIQQHQETLLPKLLSQDQVLHFHTSFKLFLLFILRTVDFIFTGLDGKQQWLILSGLCPTAALLTGKPRKNAGSC